MKIIGKTIQDVQMANQNDVFDVQLGATIAVAKVNDEFGDWALIEDGEEQDWFDTYQEAVKAAHEWISDDQVVNVFGYTTVRKFSHLSKSSQAECLRIAKKA